MSSPTSTLRIAVAGNPNTGKTTLFNRLTGSRGKVGNYPGVTVDRHFGRMKLPGIGSVEIIDVPGTYSLAARSEEEQVALRQIAGLPPLERPHLVVAVVDATQLVRNLYLVLQLIELNEPVVIALNMIDQLESNAQEVDAARLAEKLGIPVVPVVAKTGQGFDELRATLGKVLLDPDLGRPDAPWTPTEPDLVADVDAVAEKIPEIWHEGNEMRRRAMALWALLSIDEVDELADIPADLRTTVHERREAGEKAGRNIEEEIVRGRYSWIDERAGSFLREEARRKSSTDRIDSVLLHPALGFVVFLGVMTLVFQSLFAFADPAIRLVENVFAYLGEAAAATLPPGFFADLIVEGIIAGVGGVLVFLPQILLLFFFVGLMEDTGYMSRVAYLMDRIMRMVGLHGRAFVPMLSGFACAVPAILATRTMERRRDRLLTMMVVPLMTCSARLPVYSLLIAALYPPDAEHPFVQGLLMVAMYLFSTLIALIAAAVLGRTVLKGPRTPLLVEMPPYRMPHWASVMRMMWQKSSVFVREAGTVILVCTIGMWLLLSYPKDAELAASFEAQRVEAHAEFAEASDALHDRLTTINATESSVSLRESYGGALGKSIEPLLEPLGFDWKVGVGLIGAFAAREVFVSTMAVVYGLDAGMDETSGVLRDRIRSQEWPDGRRVYSPLAIFSLMVFFALACQCMSTLAAVRRETASWTWPTFLFVYMTALAWVASFVIYQGGQLFGWV